jgi:hypothetical protein
MVLGVLLFSRVFFYHSTDDTLFFLCMRYFSASLVSAVLGVVLPAVVSLVRAFAPVFVSVRTYEKEAFLGKGLKTPCCVSLYLRTVFSPLSSFFPKSCQFQLSPSFFAETFLYCNGKVVTPVTVFALFYFVSLPPT